MVHVLQCNTHVASVLNIQTVIPMMSGIRTATFVDSE